MQEPVRPVPVTLLPGVGPDVVSFEGGGVAPGVPSDEFESSLQQVLLGGDDERDYFGAASLHDGLALNGWVEVFDASQVRMRYVMDVSLLPNAAK